MRSIIPHSKTIKTRIFGLKTSIYHSQTDSLHYDMTWLITFFVPYIVHFCLKYTEIQKKIFCSNSVRRLTRVITRVINGSCLNGCLHGYKGDYCNESLYFFHFSADIKCHINSKIIKLKVVDFFVVFFSILNSYKHYIKRKWRN